jgi:hypothetical protein
LDNTPHVPFFLPIIRALEREGHSVIVTARDAFQVCALADYHGLTYRQVGRHYGGNTVLKVTGTLWRALQLFPVAAQEHPDVSVSHGSRPLNLASALLGIPCMELFDYEHVRFVPFGRPTIGMAPEWIEDPALSRHFRLGVRHYQGLKEDVYAASFNPDPSILASLGVSQQDILVTVRPPATEAHYHNPEAELLFVEVVELLGANPHVRMVILPRTAGQQRRFVETRWPRWCADGTVIVPNRAVDGLNLVWFSDLVVSGGGTMNREAAALGVPVYSIFRGRLGAVDRYLAREGRLVLVETPEDAHSKIRVMKRPRAAAPAEADRPALGQILEATRELLELAGKRVH